MLYHIINWGLSGKLSGIILCIHFLMLSEKKRSPRDMHMFFRTAVQLETNQGAKNIIQKNSMLGILDDLENTHNMLAHLLT